jgi:hypothetical protein
MNVKGKRFFTNKCEKMLLYSLAFLVASFCSVNLYKIFTEKDILNDLFYSPFFIKQLLLVAINMPKSNSEFT